MAIAGLLRRLARLARRRRIPGRWSEGIVDEPWVLERVGVAARWVPPASRVLDLGCGPRLLEEHLPRGCTYVGVDFAYPHPETIVADLDDAFSPPGDFDTVVLLGVVEFLGDPIGLLGGMREHAERVILSYVCRTAPLGQVITERDSVGARNHWSEDELVALLAGIGLAARDREVLWDRDRDRHVVMSLEWAHRTDRAST